MKLVVEQFGQEVTLYAVHCGRKHVLHRKLGVRTQEQADDALVEFINYANGRDDETALPVEFLSCVPTDAHTIHPSLLESVLAWVEYRLPQKKVEP